MISTKNNDGQAQSAGMSKYLGIGNYKLKINSVEAIKANATDNYKVRFNVETEPITVAGFVAEEGHYGLVGRVDTVYLAGENQISEFTTLIATLATKIGVKDAVDTVTASNVPDYVAAINPILTGHYFFGRLNGEQYDRGQDETGKQKNPGLRLKWSRYGTFASIEEGIEKLKPVDENNKYDLKKLEVNTSTSVVDTGAVNSAF